MPSRLTWKQIRRGIKYPVLVFLIRVFLHVVRLFPRRWNHMVYGGLARFAYHLTPPLRRAVRAHLRYAYSQELSERELGRIAREVYVNQAWHFVDYIHAISYRTPGQFARFVDFVDVDILRREYAHGRGVILLCSHCGPWELAVLMPPVLGFETTAVSRAMPNPRINDIIVRFRESRGMKNINRDGRAYPQLLEALGRGECLIIMIDQDTRVPGVYIDFFGQRAFTPVGAARLALDTGAPVVPIRMTRKANRRYEFRPLEPIPTIRTGDRAEELRLNTIRYTESVERIIRETPGQWVWMHSRWHTTPELEAKWLAQRQEEKARERAKAQD